MISIIACLKASTLHFSASCFIRLRQISNETFYCHGAFFWPAFSMSPQGCLSFLYVHNNDMPLSCNRTILDVNIGALERKSWRHPEADITDFFNFGFNEESWKLYCNSVVN